MGAAALPTSRGAGCLSDGHACREPAALQALVPGGPVVARAQVSLCIGHQQQLSPFFLVLLQLLLLLLLLLLPLLQAGIWWPRRLQLRDIAAAAASRAASATAALDHRPPLARRRPCRALIHGGHSICGRRRRGVGGHSTCLHRRPHKQAQLDLAAYARARRVARRRAALLFPHLAAPAGRFWGPRCFGRRCIGALRLAAAAAA
jgi:hypothetical protein